MGPPQWKWLSSLTQHGSTPPYMLRIRSSETFIIATISLAVFTDMFLYGILVPVLPFALSSKSNVLPARVQYWVSVLVAIYGAALLFFSPVCGWLADRGRSRRSPLLLGLLALAGATVLLNVGRSTGVFVLGRVLQGGSAAVVWVVGLALLADTVPQERLATATGWLSLGMSLGLLVAPLLGGVVYDRAGYNAVFGMAYGLIGLDIVLRLLLVEKKVAARWDPDAVGRPAATNPPITTNTDEEKDIAASVPEQTVSTTPPPQRLRDRLPPVLSLLYSRRLIAALFCSLVQAALLTSFDSVLTLHAATIFHWTSTGASLLFLPLVIPSFLAPLFGYLSDKFGARYFVVVAFLCACPPLVCLRFIDENTLHDKILLCALLAVTGFFLAITFPPIMAEISGVVEAKEKSMLAAGRQGFGQAGAFGQAYALFNVAFAGGCMVGPLVAGFVVQEKGWAAMACVLGVLSAVTSLPAALWLGGWVFVKK